MTHTKPEFQEVVAMNCDHNGRFNRPKGRTDICENCGQEFTVGA